MAKPENEDRSPYITLIMDYVGFRLKLNNRMLRNTEGSLSLCNLVALTQLTGDYNQHVVSMAFWAQNEGAPPASQGANLLVQETYKSGTVNIKVCLGQDRMLEELHLNRETIAAYLQRFYDFLTSGAWD